MLLVKFGNGKWIVWQGARCAPYTYNYGMSIIKVSQFLRQHRPLASHWDGK